MKRHSLFICSFVCICLAAWYAFIETDLFQEKIRETKPVEKLFPIDKTEISGVSVRKDSLVCLEKHGSSWQITAPINTPADDKEVNKLISSLLNVGDVRSLGPTAEQGQFGLEAPGLVYTLRTIKGEYVLWIGDQTPTSYFFYARVSGQPDVILIPAQEIAGLADDLSRLRDKRLVSMNEGDVYRLKLVKHGMITEFMLDSYGKWHLSADDSKRVDPGRIQTFIREICRSEAREHLEGQAIPENPDAVIEFYSPAGMEKVDIWEQDGSVFAASGFQKNAVRIDGSLLNMIPVEAGGILGKAFISLIEEKVGKVSLSGKGERVYSRYGSHWYAGKERVDDPSELDSFINRLGSIEYVDEYLRVPKDAGREMTIRIYYENASPAFDITLYSQYYVTVGDKIYRISEGAFESLKRSAGRLFEGV